MVKFTSFITATLLASSLAVALPTRDEQLPQQNSYGYESGSKDSNSNNHNSGSKSYDNSNNNSYGKSNNNGYDSKNSYDGGKSNNSGYGSSKDSNSKGYDNSNKSHENTYTEPSKKETKTTEHVMTTTSSSIMHETTSSYYYETTSSFETSPSYETTTSSAYHTTTTSSQSPAATTSTIYGSGSNSYGSNAYNDCVQQCIAQFPPTATGINSGSNDSNSEGGSAGTGATKTVIVAPSQGVLRYVPFAINATVGDTIEFVWKANKHTVSKGSALLPCNQTQDGFTTEIQDAGFTFTQVVNSTDPVFFFCATPGHCQKGMFGVINMASNFNAPTSAGGMMQSLKANNPDLKSYAAVVDKATADTPAFNWGSGMQLSALPDWAQPLAAENILYTRHFLASNPETLKEDGTVDLSGGANTPFLYPVDMQDAIKNAAAAPSSTPSSAATSPAGAAATSTPENTAQNTGAAASSTAPRAVAAIAVALTALLVL